MTSTMSTRARLALDDADVDVLGAEGAAAPQDAIVKEAVEVTL